MYANLTKCKIIITAFNQLQVLPFSLIIMQFQRAVLSPTSKYKFYESYLLQLVRQRMFIIRPMQGPMTVEVTVVEVNGR